MSFAALAWPVSSSATLHNVIIGPVPKGGVRSEPIISHYVKTGQVRGENLTA